MVNSHSKIGRLFVNGLESLRRKSLSNEHWSEASGMGSDKTAVVSDVAQTETDLNFIIREFIKGNMNFVPATI